MEFVGELANTSIGAGAVVPIYTLWKSMRSIAVDLRNSRMRVHAIDDRSSERIRRIVLGLVLISVGIAGLDAVRFNVPSWAIFLPIAAAYLAIAHVLDQVAWRKKMTIERFGNMVVGPVLAAFTPLIAAVVNRLPSILQSAFA